MNTLTLVFALFACSSTPPSTDEPDRWTPPNESGAWEVTSYESGVVGRTGVFLPIQVWYPSTEANGTTHRYGDITPGGAQEGGAADCTQPRPVVLFSHGNGGIRYQSYFFAEHLARHGFVVVAPDHVGNTMWDLDTVSRPEMAVRRPLDIRDAYEWAVQRSATAGDPLEGCVDPAAGFAVAGHSFGGYTSLAVAGAPIDLAAMAVACADGGPGGWLCGTEAEFARVFPGDETGDLSDDRVWAAVPMAPAGVSALRGTVARIDVPTLVVAGDADQATQLEAMVRPLYDGLTATPRSLAVLKGAGHYAFSDFCTPAFDGCSPQNMPPERVHELTNVVGLAFLEVALGESRSADWLPPQADDLVWEGVSE